jgi:formate hydrogenlyase subunit 3/multisubunit Na+/H+ antiporter MnhD subunit
VIAGVAAGACLTGAVALGVVARASAASMHANLAGAGPHGDVSFLVDPSRAALLAPVLLAAASGVIATSTRGSPLRLAPAALIIATSAAILVQGAFAGLFAGLFALMVAVLDARSSRHGVALALAALPAIGTALLRFDLPASVGGGSIMIVLGLIAMLAGGVRAARTPDLFDLAGSIMLGWVGVALVALGLGHPDIATAAIGANAIIAMGVGLIATTLLEATGTASLNWLGGLARGMPRFSLLMLGIFAFAGLLPPGPGFAALAALVRAATAPGGAAAAPPVLAVLGVWFGLMIFAALRGFTFAALGRPRSLRAAAAEDAAPRITVALALLIAGGLLPGLASGPMVILTLGVAVIAASIHRWLARSGAADVAGYDDGFARPPAWLPFGDPATQITASGFISEPLSPAGRVTRWAVALRGSSLAWFRGAP